MADRPTPTALGADTQEEIQVTPEMIEAGCGEFWSFDRRAEDADSVVVRIFRAMMGAKNTALT
jgi:hypothetical protein